MHTLICILGFKVDNSWLKSESKINKWREGGKKEERERLFSEHREGKQLTAEGKTTISIVRTEKVKDVCPS